MKKILEIEGYLVTQEFGWIPRVNKKYVNLCTFHPEWSSVSDCPLPIDTENFVPSWVKKLLSIEGIAEDYVDSYMDFWMLTSSTLSLSDFDSSIDFDDMERIDGLFSESSLESVGVLPGGEKLPCDSQRFILSYKTISVGGITIQIVLDRTSINLHELETVFDGGLSSLSLSKEELSSVKLAVDSEDVHGNSDYVLLETCGNHSVCETPHDDDFAFSFEFGDFDEVFDYLEANQWDSDSIDFLVECINTYFDEWVTEEDEAEQQDALIERLEALRS